MTELTPWDCWPGRDLVDTLPALLIDAEAFLASQQHPNPQQQAALATLQQAPLELGDLKKGSYLRQLHQLARILANLARHNVRRGKLAIALHLLHAAHEIHRSGLCHNAPNPGMRSIMEQALHLLAADRVQQIGHLPDSPPANQLLDTLYALAQSAWGDIPPDFEPTLHQVALLALERERTVREQNHQAHLDFIRASKATMIGLQVPPTLHATQNLWRQFEVEIEPLTIHQLLPERFWLNIEVAINTEDIAMLDHLLTRVEGALKHNLRQHYALAAEMRPPASRLFAGRRQADPEFDQARALLDAEDPAALPAFQALWHHRAENENPLEYLAAQEWYAYALRRFGHTTDLHEMINLLEAVVNSEHFNISFHWVAYWNLACALREVPPRKGEALTVLLRALLHDIHPPDLFGLAVRLALESGHMATLRQLLPRVPYREGHVLAVLYDLRLALNSQTPLNKQAIFVPLSRIRRDLDFTFPGVRRNYPAPRLNHFMNNFVKAGLVAAGIEWFHQHLYYGKQRFFFKNWHCLARMYQQQGDLDRAWEYFSQEWEVTRSRRSVALGQKRRAFTALLSWAADNSHEDEALQLLRSDWQLAGLSAADVALYEVKLGAAPSVLMPPAPAAEDPWPTTLHAPRIDNPNAPLMVLLDWENVKRSLLDHLKHLPPEQRKAAAEKQLSTTAVARRLVRATLPYGKPQGVFAVANWNQPSMAEDGRILRQLPRFEVGAPGNHKMNAADHVLVEKIHAVLREQTQIEVFVLGTGDADFGQVVLTLLKQGKRVVLMATRNALSNVYKHYLTGTNPIEIVWLEDLVFTSD